MGELIYGSSSVAIAFDDRVLAHLQAVMGSKLRRHESFFFTWANGVEQGGGRESIWVDGAIPLRFRYTTNARETLNRDWIELLSRSANSATGLQFLEEPIDSIPQRAPQLQAEIGPRGSVTTEKSPVRRQRVIATPLGHPVRAGR
jgi:hypothetical protein